jgi:hypothetical protein
MTKQIDIHSYLAKYKQIAAIWSTEDVRFVRPDLSEDQAWSVLQSVEHEFGISYDMLRDLAEDLFGPPPTR